MPEILVTTTAANGDEGAVLLRERVNLSDFESDHFCGQLVERVGWAVVDAHEVERLLASRARAAARPSSGGRPARPRSPSRRLRAAA